MALLAVWMLFVFPPSGADAESCSSMAVRGQQECWTENQKIETMFRTLSSLAREFESGSGPASRALEAGEELIRVQYDLDKLRQGYGLMLQSVGYCNGRWGVAASMHQDLRDRMGVVEDEIHRLQELKTD